MLHLILLSILLLVLLLPLTVKAIERNMELFLFGAGLLAAICSGALSVALWKEALLHPLPITAAVLVSGLLLRLYQFRIQRWVTQSLHLVPDRLLHALVVLILGLLSSILTAMISALLLVAIVNCLALHRRDRDLLVIISCFAIGLGAILTPIGEPVSTIATAKMEKDFWFLFLLMAPHVLGGLFLLALLAFFLVQPGTGKGKQQAPPERESLRQVLLRSFKVYLFVMGLILLGAGFSPLIHQYVMQWDVQVLYWTNMVSAVLDNATLASAELYPEMDPEQLRALLMALLLSGGMLIPGNIPNIIAANKLGIGSKTWAKWGVPLGLVFMGLGYLLLFGSSSGAGDTWGWMV